MKALILLALLTVTTLFSSTYASIIYTDMADYYLEYGDSKSINMDGADGIDIQFYGDGLTDLMPNVSSSNVINSGAIASITLGPSHIKAFNSGVSIGPGTIWSTEMGMNINDFSWPNEFPIGADKYIGVRIDNFGDIHYGWVLVEYASVNTLIIKSYAYENTANQSIITGAGTGGGGGGGGGSSWIEVRTDNGVAAVVPGGDLLMKAYIMPDDTQVLSVDWSVVNGTGTATIAGTGMLTGGNQGLVTVYGDAVAFAQLAPGSMIISVDLSAGVINSEAIDAIEIRIYPTPAHDNINIQVNTEVIPGDLHFEIVDLMGNVVRCDQITKGLNPVALQNLSDGLYLLSVFDGKDVLRTERIIVK